MTQELIYSVMNEDQIAEFEKEKELGYVFRVSRDLAVCFKCISSTGVP